MGIKNQRHEYVRVLSGSSSDVIVGSTLPGQMHVGMWIRTVADDESVIQPQWCNLHANPA